MTVKTLNISGQWLPPAQLTTKRDIREQVKNFINQNSLAGCDGSKTGRIKYAEEELHNYYLKNMRTCDRATRNPDNINKAKYIIG